MSGIRTGAAGLLALLLSLDVHAQAPPPAPAATVPADVTTLGEVRAIAPDEEVPVDLYRFRNPVQVPPNAFNRRWREPPSLEQVGMSGGYVMMGINYGIARTAQALHTLTNAPDAIQPAVARPPPQLSEDQQRRAAEFCDPQQGCSRP